MLRLQSAELSWAGMSLNRALILSVNVRRNHPYLFLISAMQLPADRGIFSSSPSVHWQWRLCLLWCNSTICAFAVAASCGSIPTLAI